MKKKKETDPLAALAAAGMLIGGVPAMVILLGLAYLFLSAYFK